MTETHVYIIAEEDTHFIKIGVSSNPGARRCELQTGNPRRLDLHVTYPFPSRDQAHEAEMVMHDKFIALRATGEWFLANVDEVHHELGRVWAEILGIKKERAMPRLVVKNG